jgi:hypothetical protein
MNKYMVRCDGHRAGEHLRAMFKRFRHSNSSSAHAALHSVSRCWSWCKCHQKVKRTCGGAAGRQRRPRDAEAHAHQQPGDAGAQHADAQDRGCSTVGPAPLQQGGAALGAGTELLSLAGMCESAHRVHCGCRMLKYALGMLDLKRSMKAPAMKCRPPARMAPRLGLLLRFDSLATLPPLLTVLLGAAAAGGGGGSSA